MKASKEILEKWNKYSYHGTVSDIVRHTKVSRSTVLNCLDGKNVRTENFVKINKFFNSLAVKIKKITEE